MAPKQKTTVDGPRAYIPSTGVTIHRTPAQPFRGGGGGWLPLNVVRALEWRTQDRLQNGVDCGVVTVVGIGGVLIINTNFLLIVGW